MRFHIHLPGIVKKIKILERRLIKNRTYKNKSGYYLFSVVLFLFGILVRINSDFLIFAEDALNLVNAVGLLFGGANRSRFLS